MGSSPTWPTLSLTSNGISITRTSILIRATMNKYVVMSGDEILSEFEAKTDVLAKYRVETSETIKPQLDTVKLYRLELIAEFDE